MVVPYSRPAYCAEVPFGPCAQKLMHDSTVKVLLSDCRLDQHRPSASSLSFAQPYLHALLQRSRAIRSGHVRRLVPASGVRVASYARYRGRTRGRGGRIDDRGILRTHESEDQCAERC